MHGVSAVPSRSRTCGATVALVAVLALVALCTFGTAVGRARSDLLFYGCAFAQAGLALAAAALATRSPARTALPSIIAVAVALRLALWSPFALSTGGFLLYGFNADAPAFLLRWSFLMVLVLLAAARDAWCWRGMDGVLDAR